MRIIVLIILSMLVFTSCNVAIQEQEYQIFDYNNLRNFYYNNGELFSDGNRLHYIDFTTMSETYICPNPNCPHNDSEICSSFGMSNHAIIIDGRIYYFEDNPHYSKSGELVKEVLVYSANIDGTGRIKEGSFEGQTILNGFYSIYGDGKMFFAYQEKLDNGKTSLYIRSYDYIKNEITQYGPVMVEYSADVKFCGEKDGEIYIMLFYNTELIVWNADTQIDVTYLESISQTDHVKLNLETGEFSNWEIPKAIAIANNMDVYALVKDDFFVYSDSKDTLVVSSEGEEFFFDGYDACNISIHNGILFPYLNSGENMGIDLEKGELIALTLNDENISWAYVCALHDGRYILRYIDLEANQQLYKKADLKIG